MSLMQTWKKKYSWFNGLTIAFIIIIGYSALTMDDFCRNNSTLATLDYQNRVGVDFIEENYLSFTEFHDFAYTSCMTMNYSDIEDRIVLDEGITKTTKSDALN